MCVERIENKEMDIPSKRTIDQNQSKNRTRNTTTSLNPITKTPRDMIKSSVTQLKPLLVREPHSKLEQPGTTANSRTANETQPNPTWSTHVHDHMYTTTPRSNQNHHLDLNATPKQDHNTN